MPCRAETASPAAGLKRRVKSPAFPGFFHPYGLRPSSLAVAMGADQFLGRPREHASAIGILIGVAAQSPVIQGRRPRHRHMRSRAEALGRLFLGQLVHVHDPRPGMRPRRYDRPTLESCSPFPPPVPRVSLPAAGPGSGRQALVGPAQLGPGPHHPRPPVLQPAGPPRAPRATSAPPPAVRPRPGSTRAGWPTLFAAPPGRAPTSRPRRPAEPGKTTRSRHGEGGLFRRANFRSRYRADGGQACTGSSSR